MSAVVDFEAKRKAKNEPPGGQSFLCCANCDDASTGFIPVVIHDAQGPFIASLVCLGCQTEVSVEFGRPDLGA